MGIMWVVSDNLYELQENVMTVGVGLGWLNIRPGEDELSVILKRILLRIVC